MCVRGGGDIGVFVLDCLFGALARNPSHNYTALLTTGGFQFEQLCYVLSKYTGIFMSKPIVSCNSYLAAYSRYVHFGKPCV